MTILRFLTAVVVAAMVVWVGGLSYQTLADQVVLIPSDHDRLVRLEADQARQDSYEEELKSANIRDRVTRLEGIQKSNNNMLTLLLRWIMALFSSCGAIAVFTMRYMVVNRRILDSLRNEVRAFSSHPKFRLEE